MLNERLKQLYSKAGHFFIVPVPPRPGKIKENGWDQVQELSEFLEFKYEYDVERIMERRTSVQQKTLDRNERLETIGKSYFVKTDLDPRWNGTQTTIRYCFPKEMNRLSFIRRGRTSLGISALISILKICKKKALTNAGK